MMDERTVFQKYYCLFPNLLKYRSSFFIYLFKRYKKPPSMSHTCTQACTHIFLLQNWDHTNHTVLICFFPLMIQFNNLSSPYTVLLPFFFLKVYCMYHKLFNHHLYSLSQVVFLLCYCCCWLVVFFLYLFIVCYY